MEQICQSVRSAIGTIPKSVYDEEIQKLYPGENPATVVLTAEQLQIIMAKLSTRFNMKGFDYYTPLLSEMRKDVRTEKKCAAIRELTAAITSAAVGPKSPVESCAHVPTEAPISAEVIVPEPARLSVRTLNPAAEFVPEPAPVEPIDEKNKKYRAEYDSWNRENPGAISNYMAQKDLNRLKHIDYFAINGPARLLKCAIKLEWSLSVAVDVQVAAAGNLKTFKVLDKYGKVESWQQCATAACSAGHLNMLKYIRLGCIRKGIFWVGDNLTTLYKGAISSGHLNVVQWLHFNRYEVNIVEIKQYAIDHGHNRIAEWLETMSA